MVIAALTNQASEKQFSGLGGSKVPMAYMGHNLDG